MHFITGTFRAPAIKLKEYHGTGKFLSYDREKHMQNKKLKLTITILTALYIFSIPGFSIEKDMAGKAADFICVKAKEGGKNRLAVYPFTAKDGATSPETEGYATKIIELILTKGEFRIIDPARVSKIVEEQEKGLTGLVDPETAPETGKMIGADAMIFGITGDGILQIRIIDAETGEILGATVTGSGSSARIRDEDFKSPENKNRFLLEQMKSRLGNLYIKRPGMFLIVTADDEEMKEMENEFPRLTRRTAKRLNDRDNRKIKRFNDRKRKLLKMRKGNSEFDRMIKEMREKAISALKKGGKKRK